MVRFGYRQTMQTIWEDWHTWLIWLYWCNMRSNDHCIPDIKHSAYQIKSVSLLLGSHVVCLTLIPGMQCANNFLAASTVCVEPVRVFILPGGHAWSTYLGSRGSRVLPRQTLNHWLLNKKWQSGSYMGPDIMTTLNLYSRMQKFSPLQNLALFLTYSLCTILYNNFCQFHSLIHGLKGTV